MRLKTWILKICHDEHYGRLVTTYITLQLDLSFNLTINEGRVLKRNMCEAVGHITCLT